MLTSAHIDDIDDVIFFVPSSWHTTIQGTMIFAFCDQIRQSALSRNGNEAWVANIGNGCRVNRVAKPAIWSSNWATWRGSSQSKNAHRNFILYSGLWDFRSVRDFQLNAKIWATWSDFFWQPCVWTESIQLTDIDGRSGTSYTAP